MKNAEDEYLEGLWYIFPWFVVQCLHLDTGFGDGQRVPPTLSQPPVSGYSRTRLWWRRVSTLLAEEFRDRSRLLLSMEDVLEAFCWGVLWRYTVRATGYRFHSYHFCLFLCPFPAVSLGSDEQNDALRALRACWCSESSSRRRRMKGCGVQIHLPWSSRSTGSSPAFSGAMLHVFCPATQCTFPPIQTPGCTVLCILANQCRYFAVSSFIMKIGKWITVCRVTFRLCMPFSGAEYFNSFR